MQFLTIQFYTNQPTHQEHKHFQYLKTSTFQMKLAYLLEQ